MKLSSAPKLLIYSAVILLMANPVFAQLLTDGTGANHPIRSTFAMFATMFIFLGLPLLGISIMATLIILFIKKFKSKDNNQNGK